MMTAAREESSKLYIRAFALTVALSLVCAVALNIVVDPYEVFQTNLLKHRKFADIRFSKVEWIKKNHQKYDSYIIGSSRVGFTAPALLEKYLPGSRFYDMAVPSGTTSDSLAFLSFIFREKYNVKNIYLEVPIIDMLSGSDFDRSFLEFRKHPQTDGESWASFYADYILSFPFTAIRKKINFNLTEFRKHGEDLLNNIDVSGTGMFWNTAADAAITRDHADYIRTQQMFHPISISPVIKNDRFEKNLGYLKEAAALCRKHNVRLFLVIGPVNHVTLSRVRIDDYLDALRQIYLIGDVWDFGGYNSVEMNDYDFYDDVHYLPSVSTEIAARIFNDASVVVPSDFGVFVTEVNRAARLESVKRQWAIFHRSLPAETPN